MNVCKDRIRLKRDLFYGVFLEHSRVKKRVQKWGREE